MAAAIDFNALRARTLGSGNDEEAVTVNTRALIDKVLARYSGEWTVLRELLQNAADANASNVTIKFETIPSTSVPAPNEPDETASIKHVIAHHTLKRLILTNNGTPFSPNDWARLKRIAEGNPDETKIGAFGVGFYSVFSDCEEPFVSSGSEAIAFYWKENALFTRRLKLEESDSSPNTNFVLDYRNNTSPVPALMPLCQFLASALTFVGLESVELWLDGWKLLHLRKKVAPSVSIGIPRDVETKTAEGLMKISGVIREVAQMDATWMEAVSWKSPNSSSRFDSSRYADTTASLKSFFSFSRLTGSSSSGSSSKTSSLDKASHKEAKDDLIATKTSSVFLLINAATIKTSVSQSFSRELERATKKPPPKSTTLAILTTSHDLSEPSQKEVSKDMDIFASVLPSRSGRIFIGFPTHQTTGLNAHISAPSVIPTVERESIDLNARWVRTWNLELLRASGIVCRIAFTDEMLALNNRIQSGVNNPGRSKIRKQDITGVVPEAVHIANQFVFRESTPTSQVGQVIEDAYWTCSKYATIEILSTCGILSCHQVRIAPKDLSFMDNIPVVPDELMTGAKDFIKRLTDFGLITDITVSDIMKELESSPLTSKQLGEFLSWVTKKAVSGAIDISTVRALLGVAVANDESSDGSRVILLSAIKSYINPNKISLELPVPPLAMPFKYTKDLTKDSLESLGWVELQTDVWITWLVQNAKNRNALSLEQDITQTPSFSARVLPILSKQWDSIAPLSKASVVDLLRDHTIIPTRSGMKKPPETYFPTVRLFDDLPVVTGLNNVKEKFLSALGLRKTVELNVIFERLLNTSDDSIDDKAPPRKKWSHVDLIKYLASVRSDIPPEDINKLKSAKICTAEANASVKTEGIRYKVCELYMPDESLRSLELPILYWPGGNYFPTSPEGRFLTLLGLKSFPSASELIQLMAWAASANNVRLQNRSMTFFITNHVANGYGNFDPSQVNIPFLPIEGQNKLSTPSHCFTDDGATVFGFDLLRKDLHVHASKFGVSQHPSLHECINLLVRKPPSSKKEARILFEYFARRLGEINSVAAGRIGQAQIVPVARKMSSTFTSQEKSPPVGHIAPRDCYLGESEDYGDIFDFVDFGQEANLFLLACGSKREPTKVEVASMLVKEPARISSKLQSPDKYLNLLRSLAESIPVLKKNRDLFKEMKAAPFLLASRELPSKPPSGKTDEQLIDMDDDSYEEEAQGIKEWQLVKSRDAIIVDDYASFSLFKQNILAAPQEELLEDLYVALGTPCLSELVEEQARCDGLAPDQRPAMKLQKQIYERSRLFLHDLPREMVKHDTKWLEKNLSVRVVQSISLRRSLKGRNASHVEKRSAVVIQSREGWVLSIYAGRPDLYQVSQALVHLILYRPKLHSTLTLEMLLKTDLLELRARGYNVERILRQKAAEARLAENKRQQQLEEELKQIQEKEVAWRKGKDSEPKDHREQLSMPGVFPDSSPPHPRSSNEEGSSGVAPTRQKSGGLFSDLTRRFGLEDYTRSNNPIQSALQNFRDRTQPTPSDSPPSPYTSNEGGSTKEHKPQTVTSPHTLQSNLMSAIQACRPHGSSTLYSRGEKNKVVETKSYCDERPSHDLAFAADSSSGIRIFVTNTVGDRSGFLTENSNGLNLFALILTDCASVFSVRLNSVSIFYDPGGKTIAFNSSGSIFCNYLFFQQLHQAQMLNNSGGVKSREEALVYWWVIFCHELAHNLVADHSSDHSFYTEGFVTQYFPRIARKMAEYMAPAAPKAASSALPSLPPPLDK
ncbi:hypothetical protein AJ79_06986 [Helicocarpus griseus UAMH5409]|uniref:Sacsin/Nov domain-containing protein n=1 Tax=Helicocarpus griseus UAMH5409 TaxID=1447875 RepID=A0A2B7X720_9EURO|nr:hypothetical protein AJ79_06986 [Helicocarpus griseus UAMH5409]